MIKKIISFFPSDFESVFAFKKHLTRKVLSFEFYPKAVYFECKLWISWSALLTFKTDQLDLRVLDLEKMMSFTH